MVRQQILSISASRTDPELEVHSVNDDKLSLKQGMPVKLKSTHTPSSNDVPPHRSKKSMRTPKTPSVRLTEYQLMEKTEKGIGATNMVMI